jgi:hypothetical protein
MDQDQNSQIGVGTVIRTYKRGPVFTGTVVERKGNTLGIAWHNSFVEGELQVSEVEIWPDAPEHLRQWRGGVGVWNPGHPGHEWSVEPLRGPEPGL